MNLPNKLTVARMIATPIFMLLMMWDFPGHYLAALIVFAVASFTDFLDGKIAREQGIVTNFGKFLDPIADKMLTTSALLGFIANGVGWQITWIVFIVLFREFLIASLRLVIVSGESKKVVAANFWGKAKTVSQMLAIILAIAVCQIKEWLPSLTVLGNVLDIIVSVFLWISAILCIISGVIYMLENKEYIDPRK